MVLKLEAIETLEQTRYNRGALGGVGLVERNPDDELSDPCKPPRPTFVKTVNGAQVALVVTPTALNDVVISRDCVRASKLRFDRFMTGCSVESRTAKFSGGVRVEPEGVYVRVSQDTRRFRSQVNWQVFNPWWVFDGRTKIRKLLKTLGVSFDGKK